MKGAMLRPSALRGPLRRILTRCGSKIAAAGRDMIAYSCGLLLLQKAAARAI